MVIHKNSSHPRNQKMAAFRSMFYRLEKIPMEVQDYQNELNIINFIGHKNGYSKTEIEKVHSRVKYRITNGKGQQLDENRTYASVEYHSKIGNIFQNTLKRFNCTVSFKTNNTLGSKVTRDENKDSDPYSTSGVYKITCNECDCRYIGQTGREFKTRFKEHIRALRSPETDSKFAEHLIESNHTYTGIKENMSIIKKCKKGKRLNRLEELEIYREYKENEALLLNEKVGMRQNPLYERTFKI